MPMCQIHHDELHRHGDEEAFWLEYEIDPVSIALALWRRTRPESGGAWSSLGRFAVQPNANFADKDPTIAADGADRPRLTASPDGPDPD